MLERKSPQGFTLIEILVATAVFVIVVVLSVDLFLLFLRNNYNQAAQEQLEQSVSYVYYELSTQLHSDWIIDYSRYGAITNPMTELYIYDRTTATTSTIKLGDGTASGGVASQLYIIDTNTGQLQPFSPDPDVAIDTVDFFIYPSSDPAVPSTIPPVNNQPAVVMRIQAHSGSDATVTTTYQSLITSRYYVR